MSDPERNRVSSDPTDTKPVLYALAVYAGEISDGKNLVHSFLFVADNLTEEQIKRNEYPTPTELKALKAGTKFWPSGKTSKDMNTAMARLSIGQEFRMRQGDDGKSWFAPTYKDTVRHWHDLPDGKDTVNEWRLRSRADKAENEMLKVMKGKKADDYRALFTALEPFRNEIAVSLPNRKAAIIGVVVNYLATGSKSE